MPSILLVAFSITWTTFSLHAFKTLKEAASGSGLKVNEGKCIFCCPAGIDARPESLPQDIEATQDGIRLLGSPLGAGAAYEQAWCRGCAEERTREREVIEEFGKIHPQVACNLLRLCFAPKIHHLLRTVEPDTVSDAAKLHDNNIWTAFTTINQVKKDHDATRWHALVQ